MTPEQNLNRLNINLPAPAKPVGSYVPVVAAGRLVFTSGQLPFKDGKLMHAGKVPSDVGLEFAQAAAGQALLNALAALRAELGSLDRVKRIIRLNVFVNSAAGFTDQAKVANGASDLLTQIFDQAGRHTRCAIGAAELPLNAPVELDIVAEIG
ncbi:MAG: RidA family protein [Planctomycetes bacterium]|nr:RidA family protein [Planctomycetota bacterium]